MDPVAQAKACQLHLHHVGDGGKQHSFAGAYRRKKPWHRFQVLRTDSFAGQYQTDRALRSWLLRVNEHVDAGRMTILESMLTDSFGNPTEIGTSDRDVHIARRAGRE